MFDRLQIRHLAAIAVFVLAWTAVAVVSLYFSIGTSYRPLVMTVVFVGIIASGWLLARRTGGTPKHMQSAKDH